MHEMSIAVSIVDIAEAEAEKAEVNAFSEIVLDIGTLAGIEIDALEMAMTSACKGTVLNKAELIINVIPALARCRQCSSEFEVDNVFSVCPSCGVYDLEIVQGKELKVKSLLVIED